MARFCCRRRLHLGHAAPEEEVLNHGLWLNNNTARQIKTPQDVDVEMFAFFHEEFAHSSKTNFLIIPELPGLQDVV
jgi:hypothetical protein